VKVYNVFPGEPAPGPFPEKSFLVDAEHCWG